MPKLLLVGNPIFINNLKKYNDKVQFDHLKINNLFEIFQGNLLVFVGGFDSYRSGGKKYILYKILSIVKYIVDIRVAIFWIGSDILKINANIFDNSICHFVESSWMKYEVIEKLGEIKIKIKSFVYFDRNKLPELTKFKKDNQLNVSIYFPSKNSAFYRQDEISKIIIKSPETKFHVYGGGKFDFHNVINYGWIKDTNIVHEKCQLHIRIPMHDGLGISVLEALSHGAYVLYTYEYPGCIKYLSLEQSILIINQLSRKYISNDLPLNVVGLDNIRNSFCFDKINKDWGSNEK